MVLALLALACGGGDASGPTPPAPPPPPPPPSAPSVFVANATVAIGGTIPRNAWLSGQPVSQATWRSDNPAIARVSAEGLVAGVAAGTTTIHVTAGESSGSAEITVADLKFRQLVVGGRYACAQADGGTWYCWGDNGAAAIGRLTGTAEICQSQRRECSTTPRIPEGLATFQKMALSEGGQSCGLTATGEASCWGRDDNHRYFGGPTETCEIYSGADDVPNDLQVCHHAPVAITSSVIFSDLSAGDVICGLAADGGTHCWGGDLFGQLGVAATATCDGIPCIPAPGPAVPGYKFAQLSVGSGTTCGVTSERAAYCWGWNSFGQRGAEVADGMTPNLVSGGHSFAGVWIFRDHACGVTDVGDAYCWGSNSIGQLGKSSADVAVATTTPVLVSGVLKFVSVTPGLAFSCGLTSGGVAYCWGDNAAGQLGDGTTQAQSSPVQVTGGHQFTQVSSGRNFTCGLTVERTVYCWGSNTFGELGYGDSGTVLFGAYFRPAPVGVGGLP